MAQRVPLLDSEGIIKIIEADGGVYSQAFSDVDDVSKVSADAAPYIDRKSTNGGLPQHRNSQRLMSFHSVHRTIRIEERLDARDCLDGVRQPERCGSSSLSL